MRREKWGAGLEVRIQVGFENYLLDSGGKIPELKSPPAGKMLPLGHFCSPLCLSAFWALCTAAVLPQYNPSHQCVVVLLLQKKKPSVSNCGFLSWRNAEPSSTTLIFAHTHTAPSPPFLLALMLLDYSSIPCITGEGSSKLCPGREDGWCPLPASKWE